MMARKSGRAPLRLRLLAVRAEAGPAARDLRTDDHGAAHGAWLALPPEYLRVIEIACPAAEIVDVAGEAGAASRDRAVQNGPDRGKQAVNLTLAQVAGPPGGMDACMMQALVGVDVADAGDDGLVEQYGLDRCRAWRVRPSRRTATVKALVSGSGPSPRRNGSSAHGRSLARRIQPNRRESL